MSKYSEELLQKGWFSKVKEKGKEDHLTYSFTQYVYAFYWGFTTMTTVGFGDLLPANIYETTVLCGFMFVSTATFAYMINAIGVIINELNQKREEFSNEMRIVSRLVS